MRRLAIILAGLAMVLVAIVATLPWWLGFAASVIGPAFGLRIGAYERLGYTQFKVRDAEFRRAPVVVRVDWVIADTPLVWGWKHLAGPAPVVRAGAWTVDVTPSASPRPGRRPRGWVPLRQQLERVADRLDQWLPQAEVGPGEVKWPRGGLRLASAAWSGRKLTSPLVEYGRIAAAVDLSLPDDVLWKGTVHSAKLETVAVIESRGRDIEADFTWIDQRGRVRARFESQGWVPETASVQASGWDVPAARLRLGTFYDRVRGSVQVDWRDEEWMAHVALESDPPRTAAAPPLAVTLSGHGDTQEYVLETLDVSLPGLTAQVTRPLSIDRAGRMRSESSLVGFQVELAQLPWVQGEGRFMGHGTLAPAEDGFASLNFEWHGEDLDFYETKVRTFAGTGRLLWPRIEITSARAATEAGDDLQVRGGWDFKTRELFGASGEARAQYATLARWLPPKVLFERLHVDLRAEGPWSTLRHEGRAEVTGLQLPVVQPFAANLRWAGEFDRIKEFAAEAIAGETRVTTSGAAERGHVEVRSLTLQNGERERLALAEPASVTWAAGAVEFGRVLLNGTNSQVEAQGRWAADGSVRAAIRGVRAAWFRDLVTMPALRWTVEAADLQAEWNGGPAVYSASGRAAIDLGEERTAQIAVSANGNEEGIELKELRIGEGTEPVVTASGRIPIVLSPAGSPRMSIDFNAPFGLEARTAPHPRIWSQLSQMAGVEIVEPQALASVSGTVSQPRGEATFRASRIVPAAQRAAKWPNIENLDLQLTGTPDGIRLDRLGVLVERQEIRASGVLPVSGSGWRELLRNPREFVRRGELKVQVPDADLAAVAPYAAEYLAPKGRMQVDLTLGPDDRLNGFFRLQEAILRPIGPLGVIQEINADVRFEGRTATVQSVTGRMGGQSVVLRGRAELPSGEAPRFDFTLKGDDLPFVRRAGLLVRGDLDLSLASQAQGRVVIGGKVRLRDSLFLTDVRAFIPTGTRNGGQSRPPYFAVSTPPLNRWGLDVAIEGDRFLRLRTPVFHGVASARFRLSGTLGEPHATGEAVVDAGNIRLPFASFAVRQGQIRLTEEQLQPQIWMNATTRRYGYDLRMEVSGPITTPELTFSSSPPLEAEQVLLLVMAGQPPKDEIATTETQRVARVGAFLGQSLLGSFSGDSGGADRLSITTGENVSEQGRETYNIEYRLNDRWAVTGEYDEFDDYYGGVKWRFYEKGGEEENVSE